MTTAHRKAVGLRRNTPALNTKILNGVGGGKTLGTTTVRMPKRLKSFSALSMFSAENLRCKSGLPPFLPTVYRSMQPVTDPTTVMKT